MQVLGTHLFQDGLLVSLREQLIPLLLGAEHLYGLVAHSALTAQGCVVLAHQKLRPLILHTSFILANGRVLEVDCLLHDVLVGSQPLLLVGGAELDGGLLVREVLGLR